LCTCFSLSVRVIFWHSLHLRLPPQIVSYIYRFYDLRNFIMKGEKDYGFEILLIAFLTTICTTYCHSQVGINTNDPQATLDVRGVNHNGPVTANDGVLVPRVNDLTTAGSQEGQLVYLIEDAGGLKKGFYHWNGSSWSTFSKNSSPAVAENVVDPDVVISNAIPFPFSTVTSIPDPGSLNIPIVVSGITGVTTSVTITFNISHEYDGDIEIYLKAPTGQNLRLTDDNGGSEDNYYDTNFTDTASTNITAGSAPFTGDFKPQGGGSGNISTLAGFNGLNPNGTWYIKVTDDDSIISGTLNSFTLSIGGNPANWISLGEVAINYVDGSAIIVQSTYSGDPKDLNGVKTALTRSSSSVTPGTTAASLPGAILNYASASPSGTNNLWVNTFNQVRNVGLVNNTTYYYQLWRLGNIEIPAASHETFSIVPFRVQQ